jgi:hypothetical protein
MEMIGATGCTAPAGVNGPAPPSLTPSQQIIGVVKSAWTHNPKTKAEALALYQYVMRSQIEPAINQLVLEIIADLPEDEQMLVKKALAGAEVALTQCGCW